MLANDPDHSGHSEAAARNLGCKKRVEQLLTRRLIHPQPGIGHLEIDRELSLLRKNVQRHRAVRAHEDSAARLTLAVGRPARTKHPCYVFPMSRARPQPNEPPASTQGTLEAYREMWGLAWPVSVSASTVMLLMVANLFWIGHLGTEAVAAVSLTSHILFMALRAHADRLQRHGGRGRAPNRESRTIAKPTGLRFTQSCSVPSLGSS